MFSLPNGWALVIDKNFLSFAVLRPSTKISEFMDVESQSVLTSFMLDPSSHHFSLFPELEFKSTIQKILSPGVHYYRVSNMQAQVTCFEQLALLHLRAAYRRENEYLP